MVVRLNNLKGSIGVFQQCMIHKVTN